MSQLAFTFNVPDPFIDARLELLEERMCSLAAHRQLAMAIKEATTGYDYCYRYPVNHRIEYMVKDNEIVGRRLRADI